VIDKLLIVPSCSQDDSLPASLAVFSKPGRTELGGRCCLPVLNRNRRCIWFCVVNGQSKSEEKK
jgi:hypothetical protein